MAALPTSLQATPTLSTVAVPACPICGGHGSALHTGLRDLVYRVPGAWCLRRCVSPECACAWLDPRPSDDDIGKAYERYATHGNAARSGKSSLVWKADQFRHAVMLKSFWLSRTRRQRQRMYLHDQKPGRLLDVGCGNGVLLRLMSREGWHVAGQEVDPLAAKEARSYSGCVVHEGPLAAIGAAPESFDALTMSHVLEHVPQPREFLRTCLGFLRPGGLLVAVTPNLDSVGHLIYGADWRGLEPPRHFQVLTSGSIARAAADAGLKVDRVFTTSAFAAYFAYESAAVERRRQSGRVAGSGQWLQALRFKLGTTLLRASEAGAGEELVLVARRP